MYNTSPRTLIGYQLLFGIALPAIWIWIAIGASASSALAILGAALVYLYVAWRGPRAG